MVLWQIFGICTIAFLILEMFTPSMFFLNFALAAFITAIVALWVTNVYILILIFFILSFISFIFLRPVIVKNFKKETETGISDKYIGKIAKVDEEITSNSGVISIYGERWEARSEDERVFPTGSEVKIVRNESIIMFVSDVNN